MPRQRRTLARPIPLASLQPVLTAIARRNERARQMAETLHLPCSVCYRALSSHFTSSNRWIGCKGGVR